MVGSAGTIDQADIGKPVLSGSTVAFPELLPPTLEPLALAPVLPLETGTAMVRYNVDATDNLFEGGTHLSQPQRRTPYLN